MSTENETGQPEQPIAPQSLEDIANIGLPPEEEEGAPVLDESQMDEPPETVDKSTEIPDATVVAPEQSEVAESDANESESRPRIRHPKQSVHDSYPSTSAARTYDEDDEEEEIIAMPPAIESTAQSTLENLNNISLAKNEDSARWATALANGMEHNVMSDGLSATLEDPEAEFTQGLDINGKHYDSAAPRLQNIEGNQSFKGERAVVRVMDYLGQGTLYQVPLWHSGFWVTFKSPPDSEIIELHRRLISDKIEFGRLTYGMIFSNSVVHTTDRLVEFALDHIYNTSVKFNEKSIEEIRQLISSHDIPILIWGVVCAMYPRGFQFERACINNPERCTHVLRETLNVRKLLRVNKRALTDGQKAHMTNRGQNTMTIESVRQYQKDMKKTRNQTATVNTDNGKPLSLTFGPPNVEEYIQAGMTWIKEITDIVEETVTETDDIERKNAIISAHAKATMMRQYSQWVKEIEFNDSTINDPSSIASVFSMLSRDNVLRNSFLKAVTKYIDDSAMALIGIPVYECPACDTLQSKDMPETSYSDSIIPLDVINTFFSLIVGRLQRILNR